MLYGTRPHSFYVKDIIINQYNCQEKKNSRAQSTAVVINNGLFVLVVEDLAELLLIEER